MKLAYLAPEIPALSATFVYNEILALNKLGYEIDAFSVHKPAMPATDKKLVTLGAQVTYLYATPKRYVLASHLRLLVNKPRHYMRALTACLVDMVSVKLWSRNALGLLYRYFFSAHLADKLLSQQVQHLHVHFAHIPTDIAMYASFLSGIPFSVTAHANDIFERGLLLDKKVERSHFFATISEFNKNYIETTYDVKSDKLKVIRCGVDTDVFKSKNITQLSSPVKLGVVGRLVEKKGLDTLISAINLLKNDFQDFTLDIAGSGPLEMELKEQVELMGLSDKVNFKGPLSHDQVVTFVRGLDMFILPCKKDKQGDMDGIPVVLMEAMMLGTSVISSRITGIPELVIDDETGLLIDPNNAEQLASYILNLIHDDELRARLTMSAIKKVEEEFAQDVNAKRLSTLFHQ